MSSPVELSSIHAFVPAWREHSQSEPLELDPFLYPTLLKPTLKVPFTSISSFNFLRIQYLSTYFMYLELPYLSIYSMYTEA